MAVSRPRPSREEASERRNSDSKPKSGRGLSKKNSVKREYTDFEQFVADVGDANIHLISATFRTGMPVDLNRLAAFISEGKCQWLQVLSLEGVKFLNVPVGENALKQLITAMRSADHDPNNRLLPKFFHLNVAGTDLTPADAKDLADLLPKFSEITLNLDNNQLGDEGATSIAAGLKALENKPARKIRLQLQHNGIHDAGLRSFIDIFTGDFVNYNLKWSIELGNRRKEGIEGRENKYAAGESSALLQLIKSPAIFPLFRGNKAIVKLAECQLGKHIQREWQKTSVGSALTSPFKKLTGGARETRSAAEGDEHQLVPTVSQRFFRQEHVKKEKEKEADKQSYKPFAQIVRRQLGVPAGEASDLEPLTFDNGNSSIYGVRLYADYHEGINKAEPKASNDSIIIGYTHQGLPFQIVINGQDDNPNLLDFIRQHVIPAMPKVAAELMNAEDRYQAVIHRLIKEIYTLQKEHASDTNFAMAMGMMYEQAETLYCAGFGIGDVRLLLLPVNAEQIPLPLHGQVTEDAFNADAGKHVSQVIARNQAFNRQVRRGQEVFSCTRLSEGLLTPTGGIDLSKLDPEVHSLFDAVKEANLRLHRERRDRIEVGKETEKFGDDNMLGVMKAPTSDLQNFIKEYIKFDALLWDHQKPHPDLYATGKLLEDDIKSLKAKTSDENLPELTNLLKVINKAIQSPSEESVSILLQVANQAKGAPSPIMKGLGIALMLFGGALALLGGFAMSASFCAFLAGIFPVAVPSMAISASVTAVGVSLFSAGLGLFVGGQRQTGLAKEIDDVAQECHKLIP